ncbi:hypothetical protein BDL97_15G042000 [Sphagnum fallax]|nr:hypothetical protein BDL97_15G042000 [Sphagnum fallax]
MTAAVRRAVQYQGVQLQTVLSLARPGCIASSDLIAADAKHRQMPTALSSIVVPHDWLWLQDRRSSEAYPCGLTTPCKAWNHATVRRYYMRNISQLVATANCKRAFLVDTLALVRRLESQGLTAKQAEAITAVITEVLNDSLENVAQAFTSKTEMQRSEMMAEAALSKFKGEVQSAQEHHFATLQRETERLRTDIDKMRSELRYEIDKVTAGQRLDLNLERGRIREELATQSSETSNLTNKLDREIHTLKTQLEAAKFDVIKYCIGTIVSVTAVGLGLLRILMPFAKPCEENGVRRQIQLSRSVDLPQKLVHKHVPTSGFGDLTGCHIVSFMYELPQVALKELRFNLMSEVVLLLISRFQHLLMMFADESKSSSCRYKCLVPIPASTLRHFMFCFFQVVATFGNVTHFLALLHPFITLTAHKQSCV